MPAPTPDQEKLVKLINKFRGISQYKSITSVPMENALDCLNVMVSTIGNLEKFRSPVNLVGGPAIVSPYAYIDTLFMFTQGNGTRQLFLNAGNNIAYYTDPEDGTPLVLTAVANNALYNARHRYVSSNNLLFGANGLIVWKWNGVGPILNWGLPKPTSPPMLGWTIALSNINRIGSTLFLGYASGGLPLFQDYTSLFSQAGDLMTVSGVTGDPTFNGNFIVTANTGVVQLASPVSGNSGPYLNQGSIILYTVALHNVGGSTYGNVIQVSRTNGVATVGFGGGTAAFWYPAALCNYPGEEVTISGIPAPHDSFNGVYPATATSIGFASSISFNQLGPDVLPVAPAAGGTVVGGFSNQITPRTWRFSWAISATGEEGPASDISVFNPNGSSGIGNNFRALLTIPAPPAGYGIDSFFLYAPEDGGGVWETVPGPNPDSSWPIAGGGQVTLISDGFNDSVLDPTIPANYINYPPPQNMKFLTKFQGRIFGGGMPDAPQDIVYSGFDQIYRGRPESSWPPLNRIRLAIGADTLAGFGVLLNGVIAWDNSNKMYMFSGTIQDITTTQPVQIADQLEEEPWQVGLSSADSVQSTPRGVVWVGADMTVQIWNGIFYGEIIGPRDLTANFYPYMSRITPSQRPFIQSAYFNWLERDWYVLNVAVDGSLTPNRLFFFDLSQEGADNLGIWVSDIACDSITVKVDTKGNRELVASIQGQICKLSISSTSTNGIHKTVSSTTNELYAYWESGFWQDDPHMTKMYRYGRLTTDQGGFNLIATIVNDETVKLRDRNPPQLRPSLSVGGRFALNRRGRRVKMRIEFPLYDVDASVLELYLTAIALGEI